MNIPKAALILSFAMAGSVDSGAASILADSTFDSDAEGWFIDDFYSPGAPIAPTWDAAGFIRTIDTHAWTAFHASSEFLGDQSAAYGGSLYFEERDAFTDGVMYPQVFITDGTTDLGFATATPGTSFTSFSIPFLAAAGWYHSDSTPATEAELQAVLANLTSLRISADWHTGDDISDLDNVFLYSGDVSEPIPEPASTLAVSLFTIAAIASRLRKKSAK